MREKGDFKKSRMAIAGRKGHGTLLFNGYRVSVLRDEEFRRWMVVAQEYEHI